jgi:hypothetical protein
MGNNPLLDRCDQRPHGLEFRCQHHQARMSLRWQALIRTACNDRQQLREPCFALCRGYAELTQVRPQRIDHLGSLPHQQIACPMQHQLALLLGRLDLDKAHGRPPHRLAD